MRTTSGAPPSGQKRGIRDEIKTGAIDTHTFASTRRPEARMQSKNITRALAYYPRTETAQGSGVIDTTAGDGAAL